MANAGSVEAGKSPSATVDPETSMGSTTGGAEWGSTMLPCKSDLSRKGCWTLRLLCANLLTWGCLMPSDPQILPMVSLGAPGGWVGWWLAHPLIFMCPGSQDWAKDLLLGIFLSSEHGVQIHTPKSLSDCKWGN